MPTALLLNCYGRLICLSQPLVDRRLLCVAGQLCLEPGHLKLSFCPSCWMLQIVSNTTFTIYASKGEMRRPEDVPTDSSHDVLRFPTSPGIGWGRSSKSRGKKCRPHSPPSGA